jgi:hypothetical protein
VKIRARAVEHAALPILLEGDLDAMSAQMLKCSRVLAVCNSEGRMHTAMVVGHGLIGGLRNRPAISGREAVVLEAINDRLLVQVGSNQWVIDRDEVQKR